MAIILTDQELINAKRDIDDIGKAVNKKEVVHPRYGDSFKSLPMIIDEFQISSDAAEAAAITAVESANIAQSSSQIAQDSAALAELAATAATIGGKVYNTPEAGVDPVTGVADGAYFNVRSSNGESYLDEYQNVSGAAVATGKRYLSAIGVQQQEKPASTIKDASGKNQQEINDYHPSVKTSLSLQSALTAQDTQKLSSNFFPSQKGNYQVTETLVLQEPTMLYGDRGATYNRGGGKQGNIELTADVGFDLGNYRTYQAGLTTPDLVNKKSGNPADQWTVKNLSFVQATGQALRSKTAILHTSRTNGPDRGLILKEVSGTGLKHLVRTTNSDLETQIATVAIDGVCASNNAIPFKFDGATNGGLVINSQIEQNTQGALHGYMNGPWHLINNMLEGQPNAIKVEVPPVTGNRTMLVAHGNYFEANSGDYVAEIKNSASGGAVDFAYNWALNITAKDYIKINESAPLQVFNKDPRPVTFYKQNLAEYGSDFLSYRVKHWVQREFNASTKMGAFVLIEKFLNFHKAQSTFTQANRLASKLVETPFGKIRAAENNTFLTIPLNVLAGDVIQFNLLVNTNSVEPTIQVYNSNTSVVVAESAPGIGSAFGRWALLTFTCKSDIDTTALRVRLYNGTSDGRILAAASAKVITARADLGYDIYPELPVLNTGENGYTVLLDDYILNGETDIKDALQRVRAHMILVGGGTVKASAGKEYIFTVNSEADTFDFPSNTLLDFQGAKLHIGHNQNGPDYLLYFKSSARNAGLINVDPVWHGTFNSNQEQVTKYGVTTFRYSFNAIVGLFGNYNGFKLHNVNPSGATDANYYDALIRSFTGTGKGADIADINASHYSNLISDGYAGAKIRRITGTKRSNASNAVYGPSHLAYVGLTDNSVIDDVYEYGSVLGDGTAYTGATIQTTALLKGSKILNVTTTMQNAASVLLKGVADATVSVGNITCSPESWAMPQAWTDYLFGGLTGAQGTLLGVNVFDIFVDTKNFDVTGVWTTGGKGIWKNVNVKSNSTSQKLNPLVCVVTTADSDLSINIEERSTTFASIPALIRGLTNSDLTLNLKGKLSDINATAHPVSGSTWPANSGNDVKVINPNKNSKIVWANESERNGSKVDNPLRFENATTGLNEVALTVPLEPPRYSGATTNPTLIAYDINVSVIDTANKNHSYFGVFRVVLSSGLAVSNQKNVQLIGTEAKFGDAITVTPVVSADNTEVTFTATRTSGNYLGRIVADVKQVLKI